MFSVHTQSTRKQRTNPQKSTQTKTNQESTTTPRETDIEPQVSAVANPKLGAAQSAVTTATMDAHIPPQPARPTTQEKVGKRNRTTTEGGGTSSSNNSKLRISLVKPVAVRSMYKGTVQTTVCATSPDGSTSERVFEHNLHDSELGRGSFGRVYRATLHHTMRPIAIKTVHLDRRYAVCFPQFMDAH